MIKKKIKLPNINEERLKHYYRKFKVNLERQKTIQKIRETIYA